eukprot:SAG22_NODE_2117_length_2985_cov_6.178794_4_plen_38_part_01
MDEPQPQASPMLLSSEEIAAVCSQLLEPVSPFCSTTST